MVKVISILKTVFVVGLIAVVGYFGFWNGVWTLKLEGSAGQAAPKSLNMYPTDLVAEGYTAEFLLEEYLNGEPIEWQRVDTFSSTSTTTYYEDDIRELRGSWDDTTKTYTGSGNDAIYDAITIFLLGAYNESTVPYYQFWLDAGGTAAIGTALSGGLMVQGTTKVYNGEEYKSLYKEQINALANVQASQTLIEAAQGIDSLNKAIREGYAENKYYYTKGNSPSYITDTETGNFPKPASDDPGYTVANWTSTGNDNIGSTHYAYSQKDQSADAKWRFVYKEDGTVEREKNWGEMYQQKYIIDLQNDAAVGEWFNSASILTYYLDAEDRVLNSEGIYVDNRDNYVDANGELSETPVKGVIPTGEDCRYFLRAKFSADLPELPEDFDDYTPDEQYAYLYTQKGFDKKAINTANKAKLVGYTGANPVIYTQLTYVADVWDIGIYRNWRTEEGWFGSMVGMQSNVKPYSPQEYTYCKYELDEEGNIAVDEEGNQIETLTEAAVLADINKYIVNRNEEPAEGEEAE